ncbi:serine aminopeptidase domain-containing protein [Kitasatospora sp. NPDC059747]|uniref:serine aminopeptidase domain-containing protein n=1 Tax=Kitasatospora sp. NPDC059747 TaxID=3346930 RepID=UPI003660C471
MPRPCEHLRIHQRPAMPDAGVLLLPGGRSDGLAPPRRTNLPALRMLLFARALRRPLPRAVVASVRYRHHGWNGSRADPVADAQAAMDALETLAPDAPLLLVGHSMGARAAVAAAGRPPVVGVVALAPWCPPGDPVDQLKGRRVLLLHDRSDRVTSAALAWEFARRAADAGAVVEAVPMARGGHTMLRGAGEWHRLTAEFASAVLDVTENAYPAQDAE